MWSQLFYCRYRHGQVSVESLTIFMPEAVHGSHRSVMDGLEPAFPASGKRWLMKVCSTYEMSIKKIVFIGTARRWLISGFPIGNGAA